MLILIICVLAPTNHTIPSIIPSVASHFNIINFLVSFVGLHLIIKNFIKISCIILYIYEIY